MILSIALTELFEQYEGSAMLVPLLMVVQIVYRDVQTLILGGRPEIEVYGI